MDSPTNYKKANRFRRGWELTKSSWRVLVLDKELAALPIIGAFTALVSLIVFSGVCIGLAVSSLAVNSWIRHIPFHSNSFSVQGTAAVIPLIVLGVLVITLFTIIGNVFNAAIIYGATQRFRGEDPTIRSSLAGATRKLGPLAAFSVVSSSVGILLQALRDRLPFIGDMIVNLGGLAWSIATIFAVPVIVLSDEKVGPIQATKESMQTIRKVWGEGMVAQAGIAIVSVLGYLAYIALSILIVQVNFALHVPTAVKGSLFSLDVLGMIALFIFFGTLSTIAKAAMYHYATTGEAPEAFSKDLLQASMTVKKARRIFG